MSFIDRPALSPFPGIFAAVIFAVASAHATIGIDSQMLLGNPSGATANPANTNHYLMQRDVEAFDYSDALGVPVWVSYDLTSSDIGSAERQNTFRPDPSLPANFYQVQATDYTGSGYDRSQLCPSLHRTDSVPDNNSTFFMDNMLPLTPDNHQGPWSAFEAYCKDLTVAGNELLIICGPSGFGATRIANGKVAVPAYDWQVVVVVPPGPGNTLSRITATNRVIVVKFPNIASIDLRTNLWQNYLTNAAAIERDTGFTFFTALSLDIGVNLRYKIDGQPLSFPAPTITGFSPVTGPGNTPVVITGTNLDYATNVLFNGRSAAFKVNSPTSLTASVPLGGTTGPMRIGTVGGSAITSSNFTVTPGTNIDLMISASHNGNFQRDDLAATYTIIVSNIGNAMSSGTVTVTDTLPVGFKLTGISGTGWTTNLNARTAFRSDALASGDAYPPLTFTSYIAPDAPYIGTNVVTLSGGNDPVLTNNTVSEIVPIYDFSGTSDLAIIASHSGHFTQGDIGNAYTLIITNIGNHHSSNGVVSLLDTLPAGLTATAIAGSGWTVNLGTLVCTRSDPLEGGQAYPPVTITVDVATNAPGAVYNSAAFGNGGSDINTANNTTVDTTIIYSAGSLATATNIVISQVYGGGGGNGASHQNDFVELFNPLAGPVNVNNWSVQYASATGTNWSTNLVALTGTIPSHHYYLVKMFAASTTGTALPAADAANTNINLIATGGKVALVNNLTPLTTTNPASAPGVIDFVGYGNSANGFEGLGAVKNSIGGNDTSIARGNGGYLDRNNNSNDFTVFFPANPRNSSQVVELSPIQEWRLTWFGTSANAGNAADTNRVTGDRMPNLLKYAFGLNPLVATNSPVTEDISGGHLRVTAPKNPNATDVTLNVEFSSSFSGGWSTTNTIIDQSSPTLLQAHDNGFYGEEGMRVGRVRVDRP